MIKDELELITGRLIDGPTTPVVFQLLKDSPVFEQVCSDVKSLHGREQSDSTPRTKEVAVQNFGRGFDVLQWLADYGKPLALQGDDGGSPGSDGG